MHASEIIPEVQKQFWQVTSKGSPSTLLHQFPGPPFWSSVFNARTLFTFFCPILTITAPLPQLCPLPLHAGAEWREVNESLQSNGDHLTFLILQLLWLASFLPSELLVLVGSCSYQETPILLFEPKLECLEPPHQAHVLILGCLKSRSRGARRVK